MSFPYVIHHRIGRLGAQPGGRSDLRLPAQTVGVLEPEALEHGVHGCGDFGGVGVASVDDAHGEGMRGEEEDDVFARFFGVGIQLGLDILGKGGDEAGVGGPAVYDAPSYTGGRRGVGAFESGSPFPEFV